MPRYADTDIAASDMRHTLLRHLLSLSELPMPDTPDKIRHLLPLLPLPLMIAARLMIIADADT